MRLCKASPPDAPLLTLAPNGLGFRVRPTPRVVSKPRSDRPRQVWLGLEVWGGGKAMEGIITVPSAATNLTCKSQHFDTAVMFDSVRLPKHPCPSHNDVHVREYPITRTSLHKLQQRSCSRASHYKTIHAQAIKRTSASKYQKHCAQWDKVYVISRRPDAKTPCVVGQHACQIQVLIART